MKKALKTTVALTILSISTAMYANGPEKSFGTKINEVEKNIMALELDPTFIRKGDRLFVNLLNLDLKNVTIKVYDSEGRVVYREVVEGEMVIEKAFNFERAYEDEYTVVIIDNDRSFKELVAVK